MSEATEINEEANETNEAPAASVVQMPVEWTAADIDSYWDGQGSLDEHRQKVLAEIKQPGFGREGVKDGQ